MNPKALGKTKWLTKKYISSKLNIMGKYIVFLILCFGPTMQPKLHSFFSTTSLLLSSLVGLYPGCIYSCFQWPLRGMLTLSYFYQGIFRIGNTFSVWWPSMKRAITTTNALVQMQYQVSYPQGFDHFIKNYTSTWI